LSYYVDMCGQVGLKVQGTADWTASILPFWPAVIRSALWPPVLLQLLMFTSWATIKGAITAVLMMQGFNMNLLVFGAFVAQKPRGSRKSVVAKKRSSAAPRRRSRSPSPSPSPAAAARQGSTAAAADNDEDGSDSIYLYGHRCAGPA
jgi:hypothetical protein